MQYSTKKLAEHKLIILHLLQKMGISLSNSEICQFLLEKNYMDYFSVQQYLAELESAGWLEKTREQNNEINVYVHENSRRIRAEYAVTANYFPELNGDYLVKCSLCDDNGATLMEISVSVVSKAQAQQVCRNWRKHVNQYYRDFLTSLATEAPENEAEPTT